MKPKPNTPQGASLKKRLDWITTIIPFICIVILCFLFMAFPQGSTSVSYTHLEKARRALGDDFGIAVDANQAWDAKTAFAFAKEAAPFGVAWLEEPVHAYDMDALRELRDLLDNAGIVMEIAMGESVRSYHTHVAYAQHGVDHLQPARLCCIAENMRVREYARQHGCRISTGAVSYTHLDVYKRQETKREILPRPKVEGKLCNDRGKHLSLIHILFLQLCASSLGTSGYGGYCQPDCPQAPSYPVLFRRPAQRSTRDCQCHGTGGHYPERIQAAGCARPHDWF